MNSQVINQHKKRKLKSKVKKFQKPNLDNQWKKDPSVSMTKQQKLKRKLQKQKTKLNNRYKQRLQIKSKFWAFQSDNQQAAKQMKLYYQRMQEEQTIQEAFKQLIIFYGDNLREEKTHEKQSIQIKYIAQNQDKRSRSRSKEKKKNKRSKQKKKKKSKKEKKSKKQQKIKQSQSSYYSSDNTSDQIFAQKVKLKNDLFLKKHQQQKIIGPIPILENVHEKINITNKQKVNQRFLRKGEIGYTKQQIQQYQRLGYVMSGSRHYNASREKKEMSINIEQKRVATLLKLEEKHLQEQRLMAEYKQKVQQKYKKKIQNEY